MAAIRDTRLYTTWRRKAQGGLLAAPREQGKLDDEGRGACGLLGSVDVVEQTLTASLCRGHPAEIYKPVGFFTSVAACCCVSQSMFHWAF